MNKKIINCILVILIIITSTVGIFLPFFTKIDVDKITFETIYMPIMALSVISLPFLVIGLIVINVILNKSIKPK